MDKVQEIDTVLQLVKQVARRLHVPSGAAITQQVLLFNDSFYGYRFVVADFAAIWSAVDQTLKVHDSNGQLLNVMSPSEEVEEVSGGVVAFPSSQYRAA